MGRNLSARTLWVLAAIGILLTGVLAGAMLLLAGASLHEALLMGAFVVCIEGIYYGMAAAFSMMRRSIRMAENDALRARIARAHMRLRQRGALIKRNICPYCHQPMTRVQRGSHDVADPCGHVLYRGKL